MRARHKKWTTPFVSEHPELFLNEIKEDDSFFSKPLELEIGMGKGDFLLGKANMHPDINYLGIEKITDVIAIAGKKILESGVSNIRLMLGDFDDLYEVIAKYRFNKIYLNFSDPWPKKRHEKRRLTNLSRLDKMYDLLIPGGLLIYKSDNDLLYKYSKERFAESKFEIISLDEDYQLEEDDVASEYEKNFRSTGKNIYRIVVRRN